MTTTLNDLLEVTQKNLSSCDDLQLFVSPFSNQNRPFHPHPIPAGGTCSFIADWQLPILEMNEIEKLHF